MKIFTSLLILAVSAVAFAGPEEHKSAQSCYALQPKVGTYVPPSVPTEICIETLAIDPSSKAISIESYFQASYFKGMQVTELVPRSDRGYEFKAMNTMSEVYESDCGDSEVVQMHLAGQVDSSGVAKADALKVLVKVFSETDICHPSKVYEDNFDYVLR